MMSTYKYRAKKGPDEIVEGTIDAQSEREAVDKLSSMGCLPMHIEKGGQSSSPVVPLRKTKGRMRSREITVFSRQLASLLKAGVPILNALNIIREQTENLYLKTVLGDIHSAIKDGATFSAVLAQFPRVFSPLYVAVIRTGEDSGALPASLLRIAEYRAKQEEMLSRFRMAMAYPLLMAIVGVGTIVFMLTFVMPRLMNIFANLGENLPLPTRILISISDTLRGGWYWIVAVIVIAALIVKRQSKTEAGKLSMSLLKLHLPIFGNFALKAELARFSSTLEMLIRNGIPILKAIDISIPVLENEIIKRQLKKSHKELEQGGYFGKSLKDSRLFPAFVSNLISIGEESGRLDEALKEVADSYERDTDESIRVMTSLLEPLMILVMGLIVGFIVVAMLLPMFEINMLAK
jgi:type II secretory pathway component PulF